MALINFYSSIKLFRKLSQLIAAHYGGWYKNFTMESLILAQDER